ncbi:MAG: hypothetical protein WCG52_09665 [bacterium]|jgi:hypothetical protein
MPNDPFDLPTRKAIEMKTEVLRPLPRRESKLTERQLDHLIASGAKTAENLGEIFQGLVRIAETRANTDHEVAIVDADIRRIQTAASTEINRIMALEKNIHTRGEAAQKVLAQLTEMVKLIPDGDASSRGRLIDALGSILTSVLHEHKS